MNLYDVLKFTVLLASLSLMTSCTESLQLNWNIAGGKYQKHIFKDVHKPGKITGGITVVKLNKHEKWSPKVTVECHSSHKQDGISLTFVQVKPDGPLYAFFIAFEEKRLTAKELLFEVKLNHRYDFEFSWNEAGLFIVSLDNVEHSNLLPIVSKMNCRLMASTVDVNVHDLQREN